MGDVIFSNLKKGGNKYENDKVTSKEDGKIIGSPFLSLSILKHHDVSAVTSNNIRPTLLLNQRLQTTMGFSCICRILTMALFVIPFKYYTWVHVLLSKTTLNNHGVSTGLCSSRTFLSKQGTTLVIFTVFPFLVLVSSLSKRHGTTGSAKMGWLWCAIAGNQWVILKKLVYGIRNHLQKKSWKAKKKKQII